MKTSTKLSHSIKLSFCFVFIFMFCQNLAWGQFGIKFNSEDAYEGYTLCNARSANTTFLLDNCGEIVNMWSNVRPNSYCRLTNEGTLIYIYNNKIYEKDWNNNTIKTVTPNSSNLVLDYEVMKLENGNFLAVARRLVNESFFNTIGWDLNTVKPDRVDCIVELSPSGNIVWEWNIGDHTIQNNVPSASNFGNLTAHPELIDVNAISDYDWQYDESFMINSFDYNPELDQILISVRKVSEFMIIDHSTTTEEAKGSTGGNSGKGGDILYRWGNPQNYMQGTDQDRVLYFQHNPNWVKYGEHKGKVIVYNNGLSRPGFYSSVHIVNTSINADGVYTLENNKPYDPTEADITVDKINTGNDFFSDYTSGVQVLQNGNIFITVGQPADLIEVQTDGTLAWEYRLPFASYIFRAEQYALDFPGFEGKELTPDGTVEFPTSSYNCSLYTSTNEIDDQSLFSIQFDHSTQEIAIVNLESSTNVLEIRDIQGQLIQSRDDVNINTRISIAQFPMGLYYITINDLKRNKRVTQKLMKY